MTSCDTRKGIGREMFILGSAGTLQFGIVSTGGSSSGDSRMAVEPRRTTQGS